MRHSEEEINAFISEAIFRLTLKKISGPQEELVRSGILSSVSIAELAVELEKKFDVHFSFMEVNAENFRDPISILKLVSKKL